MSIARPKTAEPRDQQLLLRLTARQLEVLKSVAHLEGTTANTYAQQILVDHLAAMAGNPRVQADLANRAAYDAYAAATSSLRRRQRTPSAGGDDATKGARAQPGTAS